MEQQRLANLVLAQGLSVRNLERLMQQGGTPPPPAKTKTGPTAHIQDLEKTLSRQLGLRVQLKSGTKGGKGKLILHYASLDQFDDLLARLNVSAE
jgi:ParB family chromosome partitioning protein